ncbi:DUF3225 domain-containing protein [Cellulomonas sp. DKR-3]|uniref:DUF3225 domain-containing protein n=1 Tax=Cellulomonas fulva TaxID=2835530 RepID=A0ABS5TX33_9CELL|nr:DUF3225 domain-containing protein [Cellulomonas fulva]
MPSDLLAAVERYERAVVADDVTTLDEMFAPGPATLRGDDAGLLVGHDAIGAFRAGRGGVAPRVLDRLEARRLAADCWLVVAVSRYVGGGSGLQTQVWRRDDGRWVVVAAHVTPRPRTFDRSVWRVVGDPLVPGASAGPLAGLRVAVKDVVAVAGQRIGAGNPTWLAAAGLEPAHAPVVEALVAAGAELVGIARTDELAYSLAGDNVHHGTPPNPSAPGALPGGSSSGPASAVSLGQADLGLATDTAGSIRVPASYQGLWGLRTTHGRVSRTGVLPLAPSFDTVGWLTRDAASLLRTTQALLPDGVGVPGPLLLAVETLDEVDPAMRDAFLAAAEGLAVERVSVGALEPVAEAFRVVQGAEAWRAHGAWCTAHPAALGGAVARRFRAAADVTEDDERRARDTLAGHRAALRDLIGDGALVLPAAPGPAPSRSAGAAALDAVRTRLLRLTALAGAAGLPSVAVPWLATAAGPVGACLVGPAGSDVALVRRAAEIAPVPPPARGAR